MPGVKGRSGGTREPGPGKKIGPPYQKFTLKLHTQYGVSIKTADGHFLPMQLATVVELDRKLLVLELDNGDRLTIFR